jgi:hypothetical protein
MSQPEWKNLFRGSKFKFKFNASTIQFHSAVFTRLLLNEKLLDAVEDLMDSPNIVLHHTKAHLKVSLFVFY